MHAVNAVDPALLADMSDGQWDWSSYPVADDVDAYENRIFEVDHVFAGNETTEPAAYLVASFQPYTYAVDEMAGDNRTLGVGAIVFMISLAAISGLIIMTWTSRRISLLSRDVAVFAAGDLGHRTSARSTDEIGALGRDFNAMASRIETMVGRLKDNEQFQRQLIANISHDLRTPMASLRGYVETLQMQKRSLDEEDRQRYLDIIAANLDHLDRLVDHMLVLSRFDSGQAVFEMEDFPIAELADSVLMRCENLAQERDVSLTLVVDEDTALVHADPLQIAQVLQNLVENGIKFNRTGGSVAVELSRRADRVQVHVRDTGLGIAPEDLPHIFERFYTGDKSRQRQPATPAMQSVRDHLGQSSGLGLAISAKIVAGHDSELQVTSELGTGTAFGFTLQAAGEVKAMTAEA